MSPLPAAPAPPQTQYLTGKLVEVGDLPSLVASDFRGALIRCEWSSIVAIRTLPMMREVALVPVEELVRLNTLEAERDQLRATIAEWRAAADALADRINLGMSATEEDYAADESALAEFARLKGEK